jgi:hypothetical protein
VVLLSDAGLTRDEDVGFVLCEPAWGTDEAAEEMTRVVRGPRDNGEG